MSSCSNPWLSSPFLTESSAPEGGRSVRWIRLCPKDGRRLRGHRQRTAKSSEDAELERTDPDWRDNRKISPPTRVESPHLYLRIKEQGHVPVAMRIATLTCLPGPSPFLFLLAQLLLRLLLPGPELAGAASSCPSHCTCSNQASRVICTRQNLDEVPKSISVNTRYLNLQENSIQVSRLAFIQLPGPFPSVSLLCFRVDFRIFSGANIQLFHELSDLVTIDVYGGIFVHTRFCFFWERRSQDGTVYLR